MSWVELLLPLGVALLLVIPVGKYLYYVISGESTKTDKVFVPIENGIYRLAGVNKEEMSWKQYLGAFFITNMFMALLLFLLLITQQYIWGNPNHVSNMEWTVALNTAISFITNTNLQHYAGETALSYTSQMVGITFLMFTSAASGFAVLSAFIRGISGKNKTLGNFYVDLTRIIIRVLLPLSFIIAIILIGQGVPQTLAPNEVVTTLEGAKQTITLGPVASLESIKHIGTNGGGFFTANSAHPFENPTPFTNLIYMLSMMLIPSAVVYSFGLFLKNKKQAWVLFASMGILLLFALTVLHGAEAQGNAVVNQLGIHQSGNMEGKEIRFGLPGATLFTTITTSFTTGAVNNMHDTLTPIGGMMAMWGMMLNVVFGGKGVGFMNLLAYAMLTVFLCGLMVGRTPEFLGKKLEGKEMKLLAIVILIHPLLILVPTAIALLFPAGNGAVSNPGFHGLSQVLYEYTSSSANNGSGFEGLVDNTAFWNLSTAIVIFLGRYVPITALVAVAGSFAAKKKVPEGPGTLRTDNLLFTITLTVIILIVGALTFFPALTLGPIAEQLIVGK